MKNFASVLNSDKSSTISILNFSKYPEIKQKHHDKLKTTITKISSSKKTKALSMLIDKDVLMLGVGATNLENSIQPVYTVNLWDSNTLRTIFVDISKILDPIYMSQAIDNIKIIQDQQNVIKMNESILSTTSTIQIDMAKESINKKLEDLIENIDYFLLVDLYYFAYLRFLTKITVKTNKQKTFFKVNEIIQGILNKVIRSYSSKELGPADKKFIQISIDFLMISQFSDNPVQQTLNSIKKYMEKEIETYHGDDENNSSKKALEIFLALKPQRYSKLDNITYLMAEAKIMNMTPNAFIKQLGTELGPKFNDFMNHFDSFVAYLISCNYKSELFQSRNLHNDQGKLLNELEEIVSNAKGSTLVKSF